MGRQQRVLVTAGAAGIGRAIVQAQDTGIASNNGAIALQAGGSVTLESLVAGTAGVRIAAASIVDGRGVGAVR